MDDYMRRILEAERALRLAADPYGDICRQLGRSADLQRSVVLPDLVKEPVLQQLDRITGDPVTSQIALAAGRAGMDDIFAQTMRGAEAHNEMLGRYAGADFRSDILRAVEVQRVHEQVFRMPYANEIARLAEAGVSSALARAAFGADTSTIRMAMEAMRAPWLNGADPLASAVGFANLQAIGAMLKTEPPFAADVSLAIRRDLGDWRDAIGPPAEIFADAAVRSSFYEGLGFNAALTDFTPRAFDEGLAAFGLLVPRKSEEDDSDGIEAGFTRNKAAFDVLQRFEAEVRCFIARAMQDAFGDEWIPRQTPVGMKDAWERKRQAAADKGEENRPLIEYADFTDYKAIIERGDNWNTVFKPIFKRPEDIRESFQRLFPVRICTMHARIITLDDELLLMSETTRVLRAIREAD